MLALPRSLGLLLAGAVAFALAFPPVGWVPAAALCLVPLAFVVAQRADAGYAAGGSWRRGMLFGVVAYGLGIVWLPTAYASGGAGLAAFAGALLYLGTVVGAVAAALHVARRATGWPMAVLLPVMWTAGEVALEHMPALAFPWLPLGLSAAGWLPLAQVADVSGVHGASLLFAAVSGTVCDGLVRRDGWPAWRRRLAAVVALSALVVGYGAWRMSATPLAPLARVAVVQPNVPRAEKHDRTRQDAHVGRLVALTREASADGPPDLVVWPETALAGVIQAQTSWLDSLGSAARHAGVPIVFGAVDSRRHPDRSMDIFNAAFVTDGAGRLGAQRPYHKQALVPVAERMPFVNPAWFTGGDPRSSKGFGRGEPGVLFTLPFGRVGVLICFESASPGLAREARVGGATLLVNLTNDAAFEGGFGARQHLDHLVLRAIETRLPIARSANTGISGFLDPLGRLHDATGFDEAVTRSAMVQAASLRSPYVVLGDWAGTGCVALAAALILWGLRPRRSVVGVGEAG